MTTNDTTCAHTAKDNADCGLYLGEALLVLGEEAGAAGPGPRDAGELRQRARVQRPVVLLTTAPLSEWLVPSETKPCQSAVRINLRSNHGLLCDGRCELPTSCDQQAAKTAGE